MGTSSATEREWASDDEASPRTHARVVGLAYLLITAAGALGVGALDAWLVVEGDDAATLARIRAHELAFRGGVVSVVLIYASVLVASWALFLLLRRVDRRLSLLALLFRVAEAIVGFATIPISLLVLTLVEPAGPAAALDEASLAAWVGVALAWRTASLEVVLCLVGVGGAIFFALFWRARWIPRWLSGWGVFTYLSMLALALLSLFPGATPRPVETALYGLGATFEGVFAIWMLAKGIRPAR